MGSMVRHPKARLNVDSKAETFGAAALSETWQAQHCILRGSSWSLSCGCHSWRKDHAELLYCSVFWTLCLVKGTVNRSTRWQTVPLCSASPDLSMWNPCVNAPSAWSSSWPSKTMRWPLRPELGHKLSWTVRGAFCPLCRICRFVFTFVYRLYRL